MPERFHLDFDEDTISTATPGTARRWACDLASRAGLDAALDDVGLVVSELVTNAVTHGEGPIHVDLSLDPRTIRVEVADASSSPPVARIPHPDVPGGRGIHLVAAAAREWSYRSTTSGKTVWAEIPVPAPVTKREADVESVSSVPDSAGTENDDLRRLRSVTGPELAYLEFDELLGELLDRASSAVSADAAAVLLLDAESNELVVTAAKGIEEDARHGVRVPVGKGFSGRVAALADTLTLDGLDEVDLIGRSLRRMGLRVMLGVPLLAGGQVIGVVHVGRRSARPFDDRDADLLRIVADRVALAAAAHQTTVEREAALAIQRSLLPPRLLPVAGLALAARYLPGKSGLVSGDWYDLIRLDDHRVGLVIGDVVGSGLPAALVMGRLRSALRSYSLETPDPADVLERLDRKAHHFEAGQMTTVLYAVLDVRNGQLDVASAGHLPPILVGQDGSRRLVEITVGPPLAVTAGVPRTATRAEMPSRSVLLLYTDGLIERRTSPIADGLERLLAVVAAGEPDAVCDDVIAAMIGGDDPSDDVAVLAARRA
jgi:anti-sigma regulatory factor (Ser/Thr protein kinase)/putative methionine-R-sulfoxide reductase with GAF domain